MSVIITLTFIAASRYDIRFSTNFDSFLKLFSSGEPVEMAENGIHPYILKGNLNQPLEARSEETFTIVIPASEGRPTIVTTFIVVLLIIYINPNQNPYTEISTQYST